MFATLLTATLVSASLVSRVAADDFVAHTIAMNQCGSADITFSGGNPPFDIAIVPNSDPCNTVLADLGADNNQWEVNYSPVNITSGTQVMVSIIDSDEVETWSGVITVGDGDSSCLSSAKSKGDATTLVVTSSYTGSAARTNVATPSESATIVGAANAGELGQSSGAVSTFHMSAAATVFGSLAALGAALVL